MKCRIAWVHILLIDVARVQCQQLLDLSITPADGHLTYLISFAQSFIHYHSIATKLSVNLSKQEENGSFVFVDCLTHLLSDTNSSESSASSLDPEKDGEHTGSSSGSRLVFSLSRLGVILEV